MSQDQVMMKLSNLDGEMEKNLYLLDLEVETGDKTNYRICQNGK